MIKLVKDIFIILQREEKKRLLTLTILDVVISILDIGFLVILLYIINYYTQSRIKHDLPFLDQYPLLPILIFFIFFSLKNLAGYNVFRMQSAFVYKVASRISKDGLSQYLSGSYTDYVNVDSSVHIRRISQQPIEFCHYVLSGVQQIVSQSVLILLTLVGILIFNPILFPLLFLILVPPVFVIAMLIKRKLNSVRVSGKKVSEKVLQHLHEALAGFIESNLYERNDFFISRYQGFQENFNQHLSEQQVIQNLPSRLIEVFAIFGLFILIAINSYLSHSNSVQIITLGAFMAAAYKIIPGIVKILNSSGQARTYSFTVKDILQNKKSSYIKQVHKDPITSIEFKNVSFQYKEKALLNDLSFKITKGDMVGIAGKSGSGKTTYINLLLGFLSPIEGDILINNNPLESSQRKSYWDKISYVKQEPFFIHDTIVKNITFTNDEFDESKLSQVMKITGVDNLVKRFQDEYKTMITENGKNFSGGEKQRILLARALYKNFDVIILDESFNELDESSEDKMLQHLKKLSEEGKIVILLTHNTAAFEYCNKKIVLE